MSFWALVISAAKTFDPALFQHAAIGPDTASLNAQMIELLTGQPEWLLPTVALPTQGAEAERPGSNSGRFQQTTTPWVVAEPAFDLFGIPGTDNQQHIPRSFERSNQREEPLLVEGIHVIRMGAPAVLFFHRARHVPGGGAPANYGE
jgi:hypothetical protein